MNDIGYEIRTPARTGKRKATSGTALQADRFSMAVIQAKAVVALNTKYQSERKPEIRARLSSKLDELLAFLNDQFHASAPDSDLRRLLGDTTMDAFNTDHLSVLHEGLIPISIVRQLIRKHRIAVDVRTLGNWSTFQSRYESQVLRA